MSTFKQNETTHELGRFTTAKKGDEEFQTELKTAHDFIYKKGQLGSQVISDILESIENYSYIPRISKETLNKIEGYEPPIIL